MYVSYERPFEKQCVLLIHLIMKPIHTMAPAGTNESISKILRACQDINPSIQSLADDFRSCWESYSFAEQATLGEAFGINRPRNWDHQAARFRIQKSLDIFVKVQEHRNNGLTVDHACRAVAKEYPRGAGTIKDIYYKYKRLVERMNLPLSRIRQKKKFVLT